MTERRITWAQFSSILVGWYLAQSYSRYPDSDGVNLFAVAVVTLGVAMVGVACYSIGYERRTRP